MRKIQFLLFILFFNICHLIFANPSRLKDEIYYLSDKDNVIKLDDARALKNLNNFIKTQEDLNFGFTSPYTWIYVDLKGNNEEQRVLMIKNPHFENIDFYYYSGDKLIKTIHTGKNLKFDSREINHANFNSLIPLKATSVFIKVYSKATSIFPISILPMNEYLNVISADQMIHWMFFGFVFLIIITSSLIFIWLKEHLYFYYVLFLISMGLIVAVLHGYAFQYLWPDYPFMNEGNRFAYLLLFFAVLFTEKLLNVKNKIPSQFIYFKVLYLMFGVLFIIGTLLDRRTFLKIYLPLLLATLVYCLFISIYYYKKFKKDSSPFVILGWIVFCSSIIAYLFYVTGFLPHNFFYNNLVPIGVSLQIIFFNVAILSQINVLKKEKEKILVEQNKNLEIKVDQRTMELQLTNEELQAMNEELLTMNEEISASNDKLLEQQDKLEIQNKAIDEQRALIEEKNSLLEMNQTYLEIKVAERTKDLLAVNNDLVISEGKYRSLVEHSPEAIIVLDVEKGTFVDVNNKACELFKFTKEELLLKGPIDLSAEFQEYGKSSRLFDFKQQAIEGKNPVFEWIHKDSQGNHIPTEVYLTILPSKDRILVRGSIIDITERKRHQAELRQREERLNTVIGNVPIVLWSCDKNGNLTLLDGKAKELLSSNPEELIGKNFINLFNSNEVKQNMINDLFNAHKDFEFQITRSDRTMDLKATRMDDGDNFGGFIGLFIDITERVVSENKIKSFIDYQAELINQIKQQEASLLSLIDSASDYIYSLDKDLNLAVYSNSFKETVYQSLKVHIKKGMNYKLFIPPIAMNQGYEASINRVLKGEAFNEIIEYKIPDGSSRFFSTTYSPVFSDKNEVTEVTVISREITDTKLSELKLLEVTKEMAEYKLMALRSVMNPHFLFNSLNSIQYYVASQERKLALDYLSIFSLLIRKVLYSSLNPIIPLHEELEILKYYISLEKLRFENKFDSEIIIDDNVVSSEIEIPSLLIQPYVENAILHGLLNKPDSGKLKIHITMEGDELLVTVEDNGIGRKQAKKIKESNPITEKSYGMLVTNERLEIINKKSDVSVIIEDLVDHHQNALGTRIKIFIKTGE